MREPHFPPQDMSMMGGRMDTQFRRSDMAVGGGGLHANCNWENKLKFEMEYILIRTLFQTLYFSRSFLRLQLKFEVDIL